MSNCYFQSSRFLSLVSPMAPAALAKLLMISRLSGRKPSSLCSKDGVFTNNLLQIHWSKQQKWGLKQEKLGIHQTKSEICLYIYIYTVYDSICNIYIYIYIYKPDNEVIVVFNLVRLQNLGLRQLPIVHSRFCLSQERAPIKPSNS